MAGGLRGRGPVRRGERLGGVNVRRSVNIHRGSPPARLGRTLIERELGHFPNAGKRWWGRGDRGVPGWRCAWQIAAGGTDHTVPELYFSGAKLGVAIRVGAVAVRCRVDLANASTDPRTIGIAAVGCDPNLSVTSCTGFPRPWRMRRVCSLAIRTPFLSCEKPRGRRLWAGAVNDTFVPLGGFGKAAIFCGISRFTKGVCQAGSIGKAAHRGKIDASRIVGQVYNVPRMCHKSHTRNLAIGTGVSVCWQSDDGLMRRIAGQRDH